MAQSALFCPGRSERESRYHSTPANQGRLRTSAPMEKRSAPEGSRSGLPEVSRVTWRGLVSVQVRGGLPNPGSHSI